MCHCPSAFLAEPGRLPDRLFLLGNPFMSGSILLLICLATLGAVQLGVMSIHAFENARFYRGRRNRSVLSGAIEHVTLFVPCKGIDTELERNLDVLFRQDFPKYELCFVTESSDDPAVAVIQRLRERHRHVVSRLVYAGTSADCGQKVHNLMVATATVSERTRIMAFVDSDARVHEGFLSRMVEMLACGRCVIGTGYRWYIPEKPTLPNLLLSAINMRVGTLMGRHLFNLVWGGAWIIWKDRFHSLGFSQAWRGTLSDDLVVSRRAYDARLRVNFNPHCTVTSSADVNWETLNEFLRRQFRVVRIYAPRWWYGALLAGLASTGIVLGQLALAGYWFMTGGPWQLAFASAALYYGLTAARYATAHTDLRPFVHTDDKTFTKVSRFATFAWPLVTIATTWAAASVALGRTIVWRGIHYRLDSASKTTVLRRELPVAQMAEEVIPTTTPSPPVVPKKAA
jgi:hypothetical protein